MPPESDGRFGARTLGALQLAQPGCQVYSSYEKRRDADDHCIGGIILAVTDTTDGDGEIHRAFKLWDPYSPRSRGTAYLTLAEDLCDPDSVTGLDRGLVTAATTRMCREYVERRGKSGRKMLVGYDADLIHDCSVLVKAIFGGAA